MPQTRSKQKRNKIFEMKNFYRKIVAFLFRKETAIFLFFLLLATIFWFMHSIGTHKEIIINVPVKYQNIPENLKIKNELPKNISFVVKDEGISIFSYLFVNKRDTLKLDLSDINSNTPSGTKIFTLDSISNIISAKMTGTMKIQRYEPKIIFIEYSTLKTKRLPVFLSDSINVAQQHILNGKVEITPSFINIYSEKSNIDTITKIFVKPLQIDSLTKTVKITKQLVEIENVKFGKKSVQIYIPIDRATEKSIIVPVSAVNAPKSFMMRSFPSEVTLKFIVGISNFNKISANDFVVTADYTQKISDESCPLSIKKQPLGIKNLRIEPEQVEFSLEKR